MIDRRTLLKAGLATAPLAGISFAEAPQPDVPWQRRIRRLGQLNMTEHDPISLNVEEWADYWASLKIDAVLVSVTGILAFYQTKVPFHRKGKYLGDRDFFGECCAAAKKRGLRVIARMSPDLNWEDAVQAHPEWFQRNAQGEAVRHGEDPRLFRTCMFSTYMTDYMPAIMREINSLYDVDGLFTNAWPPLGSLPVCYCDQCRRLPRPGTPAFWDKFNDRVMYLWKLYDGIAKEKKPSNFYFANLGGGIRSGPNLKLLGEVCEWFQCDNQGRGGDLTPIWGCALQGRVCAAVQQGKMATNVTAAWSTGTPRWRNVFKSPQEAQMWMNETLASGMVPYWHFIGGEKGMGEDRRWLEAGRQYFVWTAKHDRHFVNRRSIANIGVVMGQRAHLFYTPPRGATMSQFIDGMYYALVEGRFLFDFIHEDNLAPENLKKYAAVLLPNTALLSDEQCRQLRAYVDAGGSLLGTFETSLYSERNERRADFGLADVFGIRKAGDVIGTTGNGYYARIEKRHPILEGFTNTNWLPGAEYRLPVAPVDGPVLTVVPGFVAYPPELSYPVESRTDEPAVVLREKGKSRLAWFPGDIERTLWRSGHTDLSRLLQNAIRWVSGGSQPVTVAGDGVAEVFAWETEPGFAVHVLNYTNPAMHKGWIREFYPIGPQKVRMRLPAGMRVTRVELLRAAADTPFRIAGGALEFTIARVADYEVAAVYCA
ncbi:MAG: beta-galactosidase trimerization domain-containing protein [Acidobacteriia bacterium]|nr:beta-galactosidase trimerization domain-containing protein [Terriglobia bacterium]